MVSLSNILASDPTLDAADKALEATKNTEPKRSYLGASSLGHECSRKLWYEIQSDTERKPFDAVSLKRFEDGHRGEDIIIDRLRAVVGLTLWNQNETGDQIGGTLFDERFGWHVDGVILGLLQSPKTYHVFEAKVVNQEKFDKFKKLKTKMDEKLVLAEWDPTYFAQGQVYMHLLNLTRHYLVVATPGVREWDSCRTEINTPMAKALMNKAERIIKAQEAPERAWDDPSFFKCKWCEFNEKCYAE